MCREEESRVCERAATERETRADQASVSKHIIMYFFKTQKATPQQRTKQKERDRGRERGSEREREGRQCDRGQLVNKSRASNLCYTSS